MAEITEAEARATLTAYREARATLHLAVRALHALGIRQTEIAEISGLTREGVRRILARSDRKD